MSGNQYSGLWSLSKDISYLNHGSFGAVPRDVEQAQSELRRRAESNPNRWFRFEMPDLLIAARIKTAAWMNVPSERFAFVPNASQGVITAVQALVDDATAKQQHAHMIAVSLGYGGVHYGMQRVAKRSNATLTIAEIAYPHEISVAAIASRIRLGLSSHDEAAIVVIDQITSETGVLLPVVEIIEELKTTHVNLQFVVDDAHGPGMLESPMPHGCDVWVGNFHKWLSAPRPSAGLVCASPQIAALMAPLAASWGYENGFPSSFDWNGTSDYSPYLVTPDAIAFQERWSYDERHQHNATVVDGGAELLRSAWGVENHLAGTEVTEAPWMRMVLLPKTGATAQPLTIEGRDQLIRRAGSELHAECTIMTVRGENYVRLSAQMYNEIDDYEALVALPFLD